MVHRLQIEYGEDRISVTRLTSRILSRLGAKVKVVASDGQEGNGDAGFNRFEWEEAVSTKQQLLENWDVWSSEEILERLEYLWTVQDADVPRADLSQSLDLWLIKAMAQEKCLYTEISEIEDTYHHCRHLGKWNAVLVLNNLAVLKARRQECLDSLSLLAEAIGLSIDNRLHFKAPFYNAALIFQQLHKAGLLSDPRYLELLNHIAWMIQPRPETLENGEIREPEPEIAGQSDGHDRDPGSAYKQIARYAHEREESGTPDLFRENIAYLIPDFDLFHSFGDAADKVDSRVAHEWFLKGLLYTDQQEFAQGIGSFQLASDYDPAFSSEVEMKVGQASDQWKQQQNQRVASLVNDGDYDSASRVIQNPSDKLLKRDNDEAVVSSIEKLKHRAMLREADGALDAGEASRAKPLYMALLKEPNLTDPLRRYASDRLTEPLRQLIDDAERYRGLNELILNGAHPQVIERFSDEFAKLLMSRALAYLETDSYDLAIQKYFWVLLLPNQTAKRDETFRLALFAFGLLLKANKTLANCKSLRDPVFAELKVEMVARWEAEQDKSVAAKFERLDSEPWIIKKQINELLGLLQQLKNHQPTTEYLVNELRLNREKEAQRLFDSIQQELKLVSREGDHLKRREAIYGNLRQLHDLAIDFAASDRTAYAKQITDFVLKAGDYLARADHRKFMHDLDLEIDDRGEKQLATLKEAIKGDSDETQILQTICDTLRLMRQTKLFDQTCELATYWIENRARNRYQVLILADQNQAITILQRSLEILERNKNILPEEIKSPLRDILNELMHEIDSQQEGPTANESSAPLPNQPEPFAPSTKKRFARIIVEWFRSIFGMEKKAR